MKPVNSNGDHYSIFKEVCFGIPPIKEGDKYTFLPFYREPYSVWNQKPIKGAIVLGFKFHGYYNGLKDAICLDDYEMSKKQTFRISYNSDGKWVIMHKNDDGFKEVRKLSKGKPNK